MRQLPYTALLFCFACSLDSRPFPSSGTSPAKQLFGHDSGQGGLVRLVGSAGAGRPAGGAGGAGGVGRAAPATPDAGNQPDAELPDAMDPQVDAGTDAAPTPPDAAQTPPDAAPTPDAAVDAGREPDAGQPSLATPGKTCAPCDQSQPCASHYVCMSSINTTPVCLYQVTGGGNANQCPHYPQTAANASLKDPVCSPYGSGSAGPIPCDTWLETHQNAGF